MSKSFYICKQGRPQHCSFQTFKKMNGNNNIEDSFIVGFLFLLCCLTTCTGYDTTFCDDLSFGYYGDPVTCTQFYQCAEFVTYHIDCAPGTTFDPAVNVCNYASSCNYSSNNTAATEITGMFWTYKNKMYSGVPIETIPGLLSEVMCARKCIKNGACVSANFYATPSGDCELMSSLPISPSFLTSSSAVDVYMQLT